MRRRQAKKSLAQGPATVLASAVPHQPVKGRKMQRFWTAFRISARHRSRASHWLDPRANWPW